MCSKMRSDGLPCGDTAMILAGRRFSVLSAGLWVGLALLLGAGIAYVAEQRMLEQTATATLDYFRHLPYLMAANDEFTRLRSGEEYEALDRFVRQRLASPRIVSAKIYDRDGRLIYHSHDRSLIGRRFEGNLALRSALTGQASLEMTRLKGAEHVFERATGYPRLIEMYLPIFQAGTDRVIGAYEIYSLVDPLYRDVWRLRAVVWASVAAGLILFYLALSWAFRRASRTIGAQNASLARQAEEIRRAYEELKAAQAQLIQSERLASAGRLAAGVVHEIGNPLGSILGMTDLLFRCRGRPGDREDCRENLRRMADEITRLKGILQGLLDYARPARLERSPVDLNRAADGALDLVAAQRDFRGIRIERKLADPTPLAWADARLLHQMLVNILLNASQAMPGGGVLRVETENAAWTDGDGAVRVGHRFQPGERVATLRISDTGPGIPGEHLERIFEPFYSTKDSGRGTGLGLAICHSIVQELSGAIVVRSAPGEGTTFEVCLPAVSPDRNEIGRE